MPGSKQDTIAGPLQFDILHYEDNHNTETPQRSIGNYFGPYISLDAEVKVLAVHEVRRSWS